MCVCVGGGVGCSVCVCVCGCMLMDILCLISVCLSSTVVSLSGRTEYMRYNY